jgi:hypothetical protein
MNPGGGPQGRRGCIRTFPAWLPREQPGLQRGVPAGLSHEYEREAEARRYRADAQVEGLRTETESLRDDPGRQRRESHREVAGELVQAHGEPALSRPDQVDLHDHRRGPGQPLVDPKEHVGDHDPRPGRRPDHEQGDRHGGEPSRHENGLASVVVAQTAGAEVGQRLHHAEGSDEGQGGALRGDPELGLRQEGQDGTLEPHH